jgi:nicotinate dehydrogenase subunit B
MTMVLERRAFLQTCGLLVSVVFTRTDAQESGREGGRRRDEVSDLAAWLHIDEAGQVTAYTGKVEIGQNIRTSLAQAIGDELRVPFELIVLVMGDTDLTPYDAGTFGSQTTPRMAPQLARAAATAREMLIDRAATHWQVDRSTLSARDGRVVGAGSRSVSYGELTKGQKLTGVVTADLALAAPDAWTLRGREIRKLAGRDIVTGRHHYTPDLVRPNMLYGRLVRPLAAGATLASIDDSAARRLPGVTVVRDGDLVGVVAPSTRRVARAAEAIRATWRPVTGQPSSDTVFDAGRRPTRGVTLHRRRRGAGSRLGRADLRIGRSHSVHRARAARAARGGGRMGRWQAHGLDRHAAAVRRSRRAGGCLRDHGRSRAGHRPRHGLGLRR